MMNNKNYGNKIMKKIQCIYGLKDLRTDKVIYIGKTCDFNHRRSQHFTQTDTPIQKYMFEQGRDNFDMIILEYADDMTEDQLVKLEDKFILEYNTINDGFNKNRSGNICKDDVYQRQYYQQNKEHILEYQRQYYHRKKAERLQLLEQRVSNIEYAIKELDINIETAIKHNGYL